MAVQLVTCKKCKKVFDYDSTSGICPKCARFYSKTTYNEEEAFLDNILASSNEKNCSYHGSDGHGVGYTGHSEGMHYGDMASKNAPVSIPNSYMNTSANMPVNGTYRPNTQNNDSQDATKAKKAVSIIWFIFVFLYIVLRMIARI